MTNAKPYRSPILLLAVLAFLACLPSLACAKMIDGIVAVVDNKIIMDSELRRKMVELGANLESKEEERQVLELMVEDIVIEKIYKSLGLPPVKDTDAGKAAEELKVTPEMARSYIMKSALMDMMVRSRVVITENMIKQYYDTHPEYQGRESIHLRQIVVRNDDAKMQKAVSEIKAGLPFEEAAKKYSEALSSGGSDIGWIAIEDLSEILTARILKARTGEVIGPVATGEGALTLYRYEEKRVMGTRTLAEVRDEIQKTLEKKYQQEAFTYWLHKMMTQYFIGIYN